MLCRDFEFGRNGSVWRHRATPVRISSVAGILGSPPYSVPQNDTLFRIVGNTTVFTLDSQSRSDSNGATAPL